MLNTSFDQRVYDLVKAVPRGKVTTYGQIAKALKRPGLARVIGNVLHKNPDPARIPCHRVVNRHGRVSERYAFGGADAQRKKLEAEGIVFTATGYIDLNIYDV